MSPAGHSGPHEGQRGEAERARSAESERGPRGRVLPEANAVPGRVRSRLLTGTVMHHRVSPRPHGFRYRVLMFGLDLDELPALDRRLRLFGVERARPVSFRAGDHVGEPPQALRARVERVVSDAGIDTPIARIELVTQCRVFGYVFNPVSFFLCHDAHGGLAAIVAEVHNTFGDRHCYVLPGAEPGEGGARRSVWRDKKVLHVSPFFTLDGTYRFQFDLSDERVDVRIDLHRAGAPVFVSRLALQAGPITDGAIARALVAQPLSTLKVVAAIHWEALRLWRKRLPVHRRPAYDPDAARRTGA
ncbi:MAG: DUF1365 domain-containing protein [Vicinamibacterales bacterium]